jgi:hypothetical protein
MKDVDGCLYVSMTCSGIGAGAGEACRGGRRGLARWPPREAIGLETAISIKKDIYIIFLMYIDGDSPLPQLPHLQMGRYGSKRGQADFSYLRD